MVNDVKTGDKVFKRLVKLFKVLLLVLLMLSIFIMYLNRRERKQIKMQAMAKLPVIEERVNNIIEANNDIYTIKYHFEYDGANFIEAYVMDTWFYATDIEKKRFAGDIRDNVKAILFEEGFIKAGDRVGVYVYSVDGMKLAESNMHGDIKLID